MPIKGDSVKRGVLLKTVLIHWKLESGWLSRLT